MTTCCLTVTTGRSDEKMALDASHLEPPGGDEPAIYVRPGDELPDIVAKIKVRLPAVGP
jgi:hypothetical protein